MRTDLKLIAVSTLAVLFISNISAFSQTYKPNYVKPPAYTQNYGSGYGQAPSYKSNYLPPLQGRIVIPVGTVMPISLSSAISSEYARIGDTVYAALDTDMYAGGVLVLPAGSQIMGRVVDAQSAGRMNKNGRLNIRFDSAVTPSGKRIPLSGKIVTPDGTGVIYGGTAVSTLGKVAKNTAIEIGRAHV